jgi:hypothetical protein
MEKSALITSSSVYSTDFSHLLSQLISIQQFNFDFQGRCSKPFDTGHSDDFCSVNVYVKYEECLLGCGAM